MGRPGVAGRRTPSSEQAPLALTAGPRLAAVTMGPAIVVCLVAGLLPSLRATSTRRINITRQVGGTSMALAAAFFPSRRASRIDPLIALRHE